MPALLVLLLINGGMFGLVVMGELDVLDWATAFVLYRPEFEIHSVGYKIKAN